MEMSFDRKNYRFLMGDLALYDYLRCGVTYYNKDMYVNVFPKEDRDQLYKTVPDGKWTYDELMRMSADAYVDLNGNGTPDLGDQFGLMLPKGVNEAVPHLLSSCDVVTTERRADGKWIFLP